MPSWHAERYASMWSNRVLYRLRSRPALPEELLRRPEARDGELDGHKEPVRRHQYEGDD
jgi:hypothetical protein